VTVVMWKPGSLILGVQSTTVVVKNQWLRMLNKCKYVNRLLIFQFINIFHTRRVNFLL